MNNVEMPKYKRTEISIAAQIKSIEEIQVELPLKPSEPIEHKLTKEDIESNKFPIEEGMKDGDVITIPANDEVQYEKKEKLSFFDTAATVIVDGGWSEKNKAETGKFYIKEPSDKEICRTSEWFHENYVKMPS